MIEFIRKIKDVELYISFVVLLFKWLRFIFGVFSVIKFEMFCEYGIVMEFIFECSENSLVLFE